VHRGAGNNAAADSQDATPVTKLFYRVAWIGLILIAAFLLFAVANDLRGRQHRR